jgi:FAD/FMN-containing dehydrogenase
MEWEELTSLVGSIRTSSLVARPTTVEQCREALAYCQQHNMTICARGAGCGGKIHLAKDQVLTPEQFYRVYPCYRDLLEIKKRVDQDGLFTSDLARRVGIDPVLNKQQLE